MRRGPKYVIDGPLAARMLALLEAGHSIPAACRILGVSRSSWYRWRRRLQA